MAAFSEAVLEHFRNPRNSGDLDTATHRVEVANPVCGDVLQLAARVEDGQIREARFLCRGCTTAIACASPTLSRGARPRNQGFVPAIVSFKRAAFPSSRNIPCAR